MGASITGGAAPIGLAFVAGDTGVSIHTTTSETTSLALTIPANSAKNGVLIAACVRYQLAAGSTIHIRLKTGVSGSESLKQQVNAVISNPTMAGSCIIYFWDTVITLTVENKALITIEPSQSNVNDWGKVEYMAVWGQ